MVRAVNGDKTLGVLGPGVDLGRALDAHDLIGGGVEDQQGSLEGFDPGFRVLSTQIVEELFANGEGASTDRDLGLAVAVDVGGGGAEEVGHMLGLRGRADRSDGFALGDL